MSIGDLLHDDWDIRNSGDARCSPAPLTRDQFVAFGTLANKQRLQDPVNANRRSEFLKFLGPEIRTWLRGVRLDEIERNTP